MGAMASQITSLMIVYLTVYSGTDQRKHQSSASLAFVLVIHRWPLNSPHKWLVTRKMFPFDDVIMFDVIWQHKSGLTLAEVVAYYMKAPADCLNQRGHISFCKTVRSVQSHLCLQVSRQLSLSNMNVLCNDSSLLYNSEKNIQRTFTNGRT